jgi:hypothetical protein
MAGNQPYQGSDINPTTVKSGQPGPSPREYDKHRRHDVDGRRRHSQQLAAFLAAQATRLSTTSAIVEAKLDKYGADRVKAAANLAALP